MKFNAEKLYLTSSAILTVALISTSASATKPNELSTPSNHFNSNASYTASGTMDKKMALMVTNLLRNPHLQVRAEINGQPLQTISPKPAMKNPMDLLSSYTITGTTDKKTVLKLKKLLQSNKQLQINAQATFATPRKQHSQAAYLAQQQRQPQSIMAFTPFYSNVTPPAYIQGNTAWIPVVISTPMTNTSVTNAPEMIVAK